MQGTDRTNELLDKFRSGSARLLALIKDMDDEQLDLTYEDGAWTIRQIVHHLSDDGDVYSFVIKRAIGSPGSPTRFEGFPGNEPWGSALCTSTRGVEASLNLIQAHRESIAELLGCVPDALTKEATFIGEDGKNVSLSVEAMILMLIDHMDEHLQTIQKIKAKHHLS